MGKRKYARFGDVVTNYECTSKKCKWSGTEEQKKENRISDIETELVCPDCGKNEFYGLLK